MANCFGLRTVRLGAACPHGRPRPHFRKSFLRALVDPVWGSHHFARRPEAAHAEGRSRLHHEAAEERQGTSLLRQLRTIKFQIGEWRDVSRSGFGQAGFTTRHDNQYDR